MKEVSKLGGVMTFRRAATCVERAPSGVRAVLTAGIVTGLAD